MLTQDQVQPQALTRNDGADQLLEPNSKTASASSASAPQPVDEVGVASAELAQDLEPQSSAIAPPENKTPKLNHTPVEELSSDEAADRQRLEMKYEEVFYEGGAVLRELRNERLYRNTHKTWEEYCYDRFELHHRCANLKILAANVIDNLKFELGSNCSQILPTNESQCRQLGRLPDGKQQLEAWLEAIQRTSGKKRPSASTIKKVVDEMKGPKNPLLPASADQTCDKALAADPGDDLPKDQTEIEIQSLFGVGRLAEPKPVQQTKPGESPIDETAIDSASSVVDPALTAETVSADPASADQTCDKALAADPGDDLPKDQTEIEIQSLFEVGRLILITAFEQKDHKLLGEVVEFKSGTATSAQVVVRIKWALRA